MPIQKIKDPQTGEIREEYVLPTAAPAATAAKPTAKPAAPAKPAAGPTYGIEDIGGIIKDLTQGPSALLQATPGSVSAAAQELVKTGDLGKAFQKGQATYIKDLEKPGRGAARTIYSAGRNLVQDTSDLLTADIPAYLNVPGAKPTTAQRPDAPLFGFLPPLAKPKSSGVAEDLVTGLVQIAIPWAGVSRGVGLAGAALSKLPGAARVGQAATTTAQAVAASRAGQVAARIPGAVPVGKAIAENVATKAAATGAIIDFAAFDQHTGRLTDLIAQTTKGTPLENIAIDYLKSDPKDVGLDGRFKNALEGLGFGTGVSVVFRLLGAARAARRYKADPTPEKAQQVQQTNEKLETAIDQLRQTTEQQINPRPPVAAPKPIEPRTAVQPMGNVAVAGIEPPTAPRQKGMTAEKAQAALLSPKRLENRLRFEQQYNAETAAVSQYLEDMPGSNSGKELTEEEFIAKYGADESTHPRLTRGRTEPKQIQELQAHREAEAFLARPEQPTSTAPEAAAARPISSILDAATGQPISIAGFRGEGKPKADIYAGAQVAVAGEGRYIAIRQADAKQYGNKITEETISLESPLVIDSDSAWRELTTAAGWRTGNLIGADETTVKDLTEKLKQLVVSRGHDGLVIRVPESEMTGKTLQRVFDHDQVIAYNQPKPIALEAAFAAAEEIVDNVIARTAVQPMGDVAAAGIEPPTLRSRGPELPELPKGPKQTPEEVQAEIDDITAKIQELKARITLTVDEPATRALVDELTKIIRTVAGDKVAIRFNEGFMKTEGGDVAWGYKPGETMDVAGEYDPVTDIIEINNTQLLTSQTSREARLQFLLDLLEQTAFHEAFHRVQFNFLKPEELRVFNSFIGKFKLDIGALPETTKNLEAGREDLLPIEKAAVAFQMYAWARKNNLDPVQALLGANRKELEASSGLLKAAFAVMDTLYDFVERVGNAFKGRGLISVKSIFEDAYSGKLAKRGELGSSIDEANRAVNPDFERFDLLQGMSMKYEDTRRGELGLPTLRSQSGPPPPDETYTRRFVDQILENRNRIEAGEITLDDLLVNNVQKFESPSGQTSYVPSPPVNAVQAYRAFSDIFTRPEATGIPVISLETIARETDAWLARNNYNATAVIEGLQELSGPLANYEDNLIKLRAGQLYVDDANLKAGIAANKFLNAAADSTADMNQLTADLLTAAAYQRAANIALESVTRPIGQLLYSLQGPRPAIGSIEFTQGLPSVRNVGEELEEALDAQAQIPVDEIIGRPISPELEEAIITGEYGPQELEELDQLARNMAQSAVTPGFANGFWRQVNQSAALATRGLIIYRAAQLLSSGLTLWGNILNGGIRLLQLPVSQALGAGLSGDVPRASQSLMIYGQYVSNLQNAFRLGTESFKAGRGLYDLDETTMDFLDKMVKEDAQLPLDPNTVEGKGEWDLNTMPWVDIQDKSIWAIAQRKIWQGLNLSTRTQVGLDTFFKVLAGQSFEYVRNLQPGLDRAVGQGMDAGSKEAWDFAQEYAQAAVDRATRDVAINGRTILDAVMTSPQAQTAMRYATFTDDIWAQMEARTPTRARELAAAQGLEGQAATEYINNYLNTTEEIPFYGRTFSMMPAAWQQLIDFSPLFSIIQPFNRTPGDIVKSVARMTPAAVLVDTFWRDINSADAFTRDRAKGDIALGMAAISLGTIAMTQGRVEFTGGGPQEPSAKQKWRDSGKIPYSFRVRIGEDKNGQPIFSPWVSMRAFEPLSSLFGGMADYQEIANKLPTEARERLGSALTMDLLVAVAGGQLSKSYYQGFAELYEAFAGTGELDQGPNVRSPIERYISRIITSMVPFSSALRAGRRIEDPTVRVVPPSPVEGGLTGIPMRLFEETFNEIRNGIPGWSESLPPRINWITGQPLLLSGILGDEFLPPDQPYLSTLAQFVPWSPLQIAPKVDPVMAEMTRLSGKGANFRGPTNTDFGKEFRLTPQQFADYSIAAANVRDEYGRNIYMALEQLINSPFYQSLPEGEISTTVPSRRAAAIDREVSIFRALGKTVYLNSRPDLQQELGVIEGRTKQVQYELKYGQPAGLPQFTEALR